jgi:putative oxidoreductase
MNKIIRTADVPMLFFPARGRIDFSFRRVTEIYYTWRNGSGRFSKTGFSNPSFWAYFTGSFEIVCSILILTGLVTRLATIPLLIIIIVAFVTTKVPILINKDFWSFAHEYRTDFVMTLLLIFLLIYGGGNNSMDKKFTHSKTI